MADGFQAAVEWSKKNFEAVKSAATGQVKPDFDWKKSLPDIALIVVCVTVILLAVMFMIKNIMSSGQPAETTQANANTVNNLMQQNLRPADIAYNSIPILT